MAEPARDTTAPCFRVHASAPALLRAIVVAALCAALTVGFLAQVSGTAAQPTGRDESRITVCVDGAPGERC